MSVPIPSTYKYDLIWKKEFADIIKNLMYCGWGSELDSLTGPLKEGEDTETRKKAI